MDPQGLSNGTPMRIDHVGPVFFGNRDRFGETLRPIGRPALRPLLQGVDLPIAPNRGHHRLSPYGFPFPEVELESLGCRWRLPLPFLHRGRQQFRLSLRECFGCGNDGAALSSCDKYLVDDLYVPIALSLQIKRQGHAATIDGNEGPHERAMLAPGHVVEET